MTRDEYDDYVRRFNARDNSAFEIYLSPDVQVWNGTFHYMGVEGMKAHYAKVWAAFKETLNVLRFVASEDTVAVELRTDFEAMVDADDTPLGPVREGERMQYHGVVLYERRDRRFTSIKVAYLSLSHCDVDGKRTSLAAP